MAESVDALVSNTSGAIHPGSIPGLGTRSCKFFTCGSFLCKHHRPDGGIGRRAGLKHQWGNPSRFDPGSGYKEPQVEELAALFLFFVFSFWKSYRNLILLQSFIPSAGTTVGDWLLWLMTTDWRRTSLFTYSLNSPKVTSPLVSCNFFKR